MIESKTEAERAKFEAWACYGDPEGTGYTRLDLTESQLPGRRWVNRETEIAFIAWLGRASLPPAEASSAATAPTEAEIEAAGDTDVPSCCRLWRSECP